MPDQPQQVQQSVIAIKRERARSQIILEDLDEVGRSLVIVGDQDTKGPLSLLIGDQSVTLNRELLFKSLRIFEA
jgi:hypothetical protein